MTDKFAEYCSSPEKIKELSDYVHLNFHLIQTKMVSEMRRKLDITPDLENTDGYGSLCISLYGRMFNELVYGLAGMCQTFNIKGHEVIPIMTAEILFMLLKGENPLGGKMRTDLQHISKEEKEAYYLANIEKIRAVREALPKED